MAKRLVRIRIGPVDQKAPERFRLGLEFHESKPLPSVDLEFSASELMYLSHAIQRMQARHKLAIPSSLRPKGKPLLSVVKIDEE